MFCLAAYHGAEDIMEVLERSIWFALFDLTLPLDVEPICSTPAVVGGVVILPSMSHLVYQMVISSSFSSSIDVGHQLAVSLGQEFVAIYVSRHA
jgi:hypothetical protein